jgi:arginyl-tRNA synthetase
LIENIHLSLQPKRESKHLINTMERAIQQAISQAIAQLFNHQIDANDISLQATRKEFEGQVTFVTFPITRFSKLSPEATGEQIGNYLKENCSEVHNFNVVKGFLNIVYSDHVFKNTLQNLLQQGKEIGKLPAKNETVLLEYSSPNTNKPLHLGHLRNNFLGYSLAAIMEAAGYKVVKVNLINDRGIHICKSMIAYQLLGNGETPQSSGLKGDHLVGKYYVLYDKTYKTQVSELVAQGIPQEQAEKQAPILLQAQEMLRKWEENDTETVALWKKMNEWVYEGFDATYQKIGVNFDKRYYESDTYLLGKDIVQEGLQKGVFYKEADNSVWIDLTTDGLDKKLVLRGDGTSVYITQDLGTADLKYNDFQCNKSIYVVGNEQDYHFKVLFLILKKLGRPYAEGLHHLSYGMVDLPSGKMKSREGTVVDADELVAEMEQTAQQVTEELGKTEGFSAEELKKLYEILALGALKYFLLKVDPKKRMLFNPAESIDFQGHTGSFIQYTFARIASLERKAAQTQLDYSHYDLSNYALQATEKELILHLHQFAKNIETAANDYSPAVIAQYVYDLAKIFNRFYAECSVLGENDENIRKFRVALSVITAEVIKKSMALLGIEVPSRM